MTIDQTERAVHFDQTAMLIPYGAIDSGADIQADNRLMVWGQFRDNSLDYTNNALSHVSGAFMFLKDTLNGVILKYIKVESEIITNCRRFESGYVFCHAK